MSDMKLVLVDSSAWIALIYAKDGHHQDAIEQLDKVSEQNSILVTTDYIVDETCTILNRREGAKLARIFIRELQKAEKIGYLRLEYISMELFRETLSRYKKIDDRGLSFTDCSCFTLVDRSRPVITSVFTFDKHFSRYGYHCEPEPSGIP